MAGKAAPTTSKRIFGLVIKPCTCIHEFQDKQYGKGLRVKNNALQGARCSVCGKKE